MHELKVNIFKPSGKWYTSEIIDIPDSIMDHDVPEYVRNHARIRNMIYLFNGPNHDVPHLVHVGN